MGQLLGQLLGQFLDIQDYLQYTIAIYERLGMTISTVFTNNRTQAVRLPAELRLPETVKKVDVRARGIERIISPAGQTWDSFFVGGPTVTEDFLSERASQEQPKRDQM